MLGAAAAIVNGSRPVITSDFNTTDFQVLADDNTSTGNSTSSEGTDRGWLLDELQLIKVIVLVVVVAILLLSTCTFILRTFSISLFDTKKDEQS